MFEAHSKWKKAKGNGIENNEKLISLNESGIKVFMTISSKSFWQDMTNEKQFTKNKTSDTHSKHNSKK